MRDQPRPDALNGGRAGGNKEAFSAELYAIYQAVKAFEGRKEGGQRCTIKP